MDAIVIINCCHISLSIYVMVVLITDTKKNTTRVFDSSKLLTTLGIGWAAFGLSLMFNLLYYALHPSQVTRI